MAVIRLSDPQFTDDEPTLGEILSSVTGLVEKRKKKKENKALMDTINEQVKSGDLLGEFEVDDKGGIKRKFKSKSAETKGLTQNQFLNQARKEQAREALLKMIQNAANQDPAGTKERFQAGTADPDIIKLLASSGTTFQDATSGLPATSPFKSFEKKEKAKKILEDNGMLTTEANIEALLAKMG